VGKLKILLELSYLGTAYHGFQVQDNAPTVQGVLTSVCRELFGNSAAVTGCSRTDSGVHARKYFCTLESDLPGFMPTEKIPLAINTRLPADIRVRSAREVGESFHARYSVKEKEYIYLIYDKRPEDPFLYGRVWNYGRELDVEKMDLAAKALVGKHDFSAFCAAGSGVKGTHERTVSALDVERERECVKITVRADGFLYNMVRIIAGTLTLAGKGELGFEDMRQILESKDRARAGMTAPPEGLCLNDVIYNTEE